MLSRSPEPTRLLAPLAAMAPDASASAQVSTAARTIDGIVSPFADSVNVPAGTEIVGPVTFQFAATPFVGATLGASTFANAASITQAQGKNVDAAALLDLDGRGGASGCLASAPDCTPAACTTGTPSIGRTVQFWMTAAPDCLALSIPVGLPTEIVSGTSLIPSATAVSQWPTIPNDRAFVGMTIQGAAVVLDMQTGRFSVSNQFHSDLLPA